MAVVTQLQFRRGTAAQWTSANPTLAAGELGFETDTGKAKIGNGSTAWNSLAYNISGVTGDIEGVTAGTGLSGGGTSGTVTVSIDTSVTADLTTAQTLTNKTISVDNNTVSGVAASSFVLSNASGHLDGSAAQKAIPSGTVVGTSDSQTLTNKTISGSDNTISNIGNSSLTNSSITINGSAISLGGSVTVGDITSVTASTGLTGGGSSGDVTLSIDSTVATLTGTQTLTNKTLTSPTINDPKLNLTIDPETASYTAVLANNGQVVTMNVGTANTFSIPTDATVDFPVGAQLTVIQIGTGQTTIQASNSGTTTINSTGATANAPKLRTRYSSATCIKLSANNWVVVGDLS